MKNSNFTAFSIMELAITTIMMAVILIIAPVVTLKRVVKPKKNVTEHFEIAICKDKCLYSAKDSILKTIDKDNKKDKETQVIDYVRHSGNNYTFELYGGGGGGSKQGCGGKGANTTLELQSLLANQLDDLDDSKKKYNGILTGYYLLEAGKGGKGENNKKSGNISRVCVIPASKANLNLNSLSCDGDYATIIAEAKGGITSNEGTGNIGNFRSWKNGSGAEESKTKDYGAGGCKDITDECKSHKGEDGAIIIR